MPNPVPYPLPPHLRDEVNMAFFDRGMEALTDEARHLVRRMCATAYATGFQDGRLDERSATNTNNEARRSQAPQDQESP